MWSIRVRFLRSDKYNMLGVHKFAYLDLKNKWGEKQMSKKIIKQCEHCYKEFSTNIPNKKYCNQYCSNKAKQKRQEEKKRLKEHRVLQAKKYSTEYMSDDMPRLLEG